MDIALVRARSGRLPGRTANGSRISPGFSILLVVGASAGLWWAIWCVVMALF